jgi:hypothetical protein
MRRGRRRRLHFTAKWAAVHALTAVGMLSRGILQDAPSLTEEQQIG